MRLVTTAQMRVLEQAAVDAGSTWDGLMEQAGWGVAQETLRLLAPVIDRSVLVLVGPGNNGGDGLVVARHLHDAGASVTLYIWRRQETATDANWQRCRRRGLAELCADDDPDQERLRAALGTVDLVVDALLGMGTTRPVMGQLAAIVATVNATRDQGDQGSRGLGDRGSSSAQAKNWSFHASPSPHVPPSLRPPARRPRVLAIDMPTGVNSDTGAVLGVALRADITVATGLPKHGLLLYPGRACAGTLTLAEIGIPTDYLETTMSEMLTSDYARRLLPARPADAHKGSFGKVMIIAGSLRYPGAAYLACAGAARVGAGLVTLGAGRAVLGVGGRLPEATVLPLPEGDWGAVGPNALEELAKELEGYAAMVIGPGLGKGEATSEFLQRIFGLDKAKARARVGFLIGGPLAETGEAAPKLPDLPPTVLDADGLNLLAEIEEWPERLPKGRFVFTPHPGEMRRLLKVDELPGDVVAAAGEAARLWGQIVVLKGATTVIAAPDGHTLTHDGANPALATAGTGDVLAGAIGGLLAQGLAPYDAAALGVYLHAAAGARVRDELGDAGTLASDLLPELPRVIKGLKG